MTVAVDLEANISRAFSLWAKRLFPFQRLWIGEMANFALCVKGRQIGFSHAIAAGAVASGRYRRRPQLILSASQDLAVEVLNKAKTHCEILAALGDPGATDFAVCNASTISWKSGGIIRALPASKRTARSFTGDVWLDEYAYHLDPEGIRDGAFPMATRGGWKVRVISTPNGAQGLFHEWASNPPKGWAYHEVGIDDAIAQGLDVDMTKLWELCGGDERLFAQWYQCSFLDANLQYIPTEYADRAYRWVGEMPDLAQAEIYAGLDVGRHHDLTVLTVIAVQDGVVWVLAILQCKRTKFKEQRAMVARARKVFRWSKLYVDKGGLGEEMAEEMVDDWGEDEVEPVNFAGSVRTPSGESVPVKADLATRTLRWLRDAGVRFPRDDEGKELRNETIALRRSVTAAGNISYEHERTTKGHGDRYWSFALALKGAGDPPLPRGMGGSPVFAVS